MRAGIQQERKQEMLLWPDPLEPEVIEAARERVGWVAFDAADLAMLCDMLGIG